MDLLLADQQEGTIVSIVAKVSLGCDEHGRALLMGVSPQQDFLLNLPCKADQLVAIYDAKVSFAASSQPLLQVDSYDNVVVCPMHTREAFLCFKEACAGIGGLSLGAQHAGMRPLAHLDHSQLAVDALRLQGHSNVVLGDVANPSMVHKLHSCAGGTPCLLAAGFPCQPFSCQGDGLGLADLRGKTLHAILRCGWLMQSAGIILECVANIINYPEALNLIQAYARSRGWRMHTTILDLQDQWASRRKRWWCVLLPHHQAATFALMAWPKTTCYSTVQDVIPEWPAWPTMEEENLLWDSNECTKYQDPIYGTDNRGLDLRAPAPTALHSWGSALRACPCGCRKHPLSEHRLVQHGLRGFSVPSTLQGQPRFIHPKEAGLLNTWPASVPLPSPARGALVLIGQIAAPLQAVWVFSHITNWIAEIHIGRAPRSPINYVQEYQTKLLVDRDLIFATRHHFCPRTIRLRQHNEPDVHINLNQPTTIRQLQQAETKLQGWAATVHIGHKGLKRAPDELLLATPHDTYQVHRSQKKQALNPPTGNISVQLLHAAGRETYYLSSGLLFAEAICYFPEHLSGDYINQDNGAFLTLDERLWHNAVILHCGNLRACGTPATICWNDTAVIHNIGQLLKFVASIDPEPWGIILPVAAADLLRPDPSPQQACALGKSLRQYHRLATVFPHNQHWTLLTLQIGEAGSAEITCWDGLPHLNHNAADILATRICHLMHCNHQGVAHRNHFQQAAPGTCGAIALAHFGIAADLWDTITHDSIHNWHLAYGTTTHNPDELFAGGFPTEQINHDLTQLLLTKGVPPEAVQDRASQAIAKLSATTVQEALESRNPWQSLKAAASRPATRFRWISTDELNNHIATQAQREHGAFISNAKQKKLKSGKNARHQSELQISPEHLVIPTGTFVDDLDEPLQQIPASEVGANRRGIAIVPATEANRFLADGISISIDALALLTTAELPVNLAGLTTEAVRFPALYTGTDEPVLLTGTLIQLGDVSVKRIQPANQPLEDEPDLRIFRISVFKDELPHDWPDFIKAPLRNVIRATTCLQLCQDDTCGQKCGKFHP